MRAKSAMLFVVAVGLGLVATMAVSRYVEGQKATASTAPKEDEVKLVAAAADIPVATPIEKHMLKIVSFPKRACPRGAFASADKLLGRTTRYPLLAGDPVVDSKLAPPGSLKGLSAMIPPGMRAMSVKVNAYTGVAGFVQPGALVDVLLTVCNRRAAGATMTKTILQSVKVLAIDQNLESDEENKSKLVDTVTLLVAPPQAEVLSLAVNQGKIQLVLRSNVDEKQASTHGTTMANLLIGEAAAAPVAVPTVAERSETEPGDDSADSAVKRVLKEIQTQEKQGPLAESKREETPIKHVVQVIRGTEVSEKAFEVPSEPKP